MPMSRRSRLVVEVAEKQERRRPRRRRRAVRRSSSVEKKPFASSGSEMQPGPPEVVPRPPEALVDEDRGGRRADALVRDGKRCRIRVWTKLAGRWRAALDFGDASSQVPSESVSKASH